MVQNYCKILYVGLANAGKTSIILSLEQEYSSLSKVSPTLGVERTKMDLMGTEAIVWDLGGQDSFREKYIRDIRNFMDTDLIFYVVDIKDKSQYDSSIRYFKEIIKILDEFNEKLEIIICIHKFDPESANINEHDKDFQNLKKRFEENSSRKIKVFKTSIYNKKSLIESFSSGFSKLISDLDNIDLILNNFLNEFKFEGIVFFEKNSLILSEVYKSEENKSFFLTIIMDMLTTIENIKGMKRVNELFLDINNQLQFLLKNIIINETNFFLVLIGDISVNIHKVWSIFFEQQYPEIEKIINKINNSTN